MVRGSLSARRRRYGYLLAVVGAAVAGRGARARCADHLDLASDALLFLLLVVGTAIWSAASGPRSGRRAGRGAAQLLLHRAVPHLPHPEATDVVAVLVFAAVARDGQLGRRPRGPPRLGGAGGRRARGRQPAPHGAAGRGRPRPAHAAGHREGGGLRAAQPRRRARPTTDREELLETADDALDRLSALVDNLLDLSRLQAGALPVRTRPVPLDDVVARALDDLGVRHAGSVV